MGLFPFASTVGSMSNSTGEPVPTRHVRDPRDAWHSSWCWYPNGQASSHRTPRTPFVFSGSHPHTFASCFDPAQYRGDRSTGERSPP
jgi:hypothetical protein